ncbi:MAG: zinc-binding dehydrogenase [Pseudomonadota bacterium]
MPGFTMPGAFAERIAVPHADVNLTALPEAMVSGLAAALGCRVTTAWHALTARAGLKGGEWLVVWGTGGVGLAAMLLGRALGARVVVVDIAAEKRAHAIALGADAAVHGSAADAVAQVRDLTSGGAHGAIGALGIEPTMRNALLSLRKMGRAVQVGMPAGPHVTMALPKDAVYSGQLTLHATRGMPAHGYPSLLARIEGGHVDLNPMIARRVSVSEASAELAAFDRPAPPGVAVITDFSA